MTSFAPLLTRACGSTRSTKWLVCPHRGVLRGTIDDHKRPRDFAKGISIDLVQVLLVHVDAAQKTIDQDVQTQPTVHCRSTARRRLPLLYGRKVAGYPASQRGGDKG